MNGGGGGDNLLKISQVAPAVIAGLVAILIPLLGYLGISLINSVDRVSEDVSMIRNEIAVISTTVSRFDQSLQNLDRRMDRSNERQTEIDRRVTILETRVSK